VHRGKKKRETKEKEKRKGMVHTLGHLDLSGPKKKSTKGIVFRGTLQGKYRRAKEGEIKASRYLFSGGTWGKEKTAVRKTCTKMSE